MTVIPQGERVFVRMLGKTHLGCPVAEIVAIGVGVGKSGFYSFKVGSHVMVSNSEHPVMPESIIDAAEIVAVLEK